MTPLHEELHNLLYKAHDYTPNTMLFEYLDGGKEEEVVS